LARHTTGILPAVALAACIATLADAGETEVSFEVEGQTVRGTLETPPGEAAPVVLLLHSSGGPRDELLIAGTDEGVFSRTARRFAEAGYASLRIDHRGYGESDGDPVDVTITGLIRDATAAIEWLSGSPLIDSKRVAVLGWSQGGIVGAHAVAEHPEVRSLVLWASAVNVTVGAYNLFGLEKVNKAFTIDSPETAYIRDAASYSTAGAVAGYHGPLKVISGLRDRQVSPQPAMSDILLRYHDGVESLSFFDMDHAFDAKEGPSIIDEKMIPSTLDFLNEHL
jgi:pimeloyl-ACP methyl ester carboxylesterase